MADNPKAAWPKTPDGTTDWQVVFEDPTAGFIPIVLTGQSPDAIKMAATVIIQKLFTRRNDVDLCAQYITRLGDIITSANGKMDVIGTAVSGLLREIKDERIELARVYVERKKAGAALDRRASLWWKIDKILRPKILIPLGLLLVASLAGLVFMMLQSTLVPAPEIDPNKPQTSLTAPSVEFAPELAPEDGAPDAKPLPIWFKTVSWPLATAHTSDRPQYYSVTLFVKNWDHKIDVCRRLPTVMDRFYLAFNDAMPPYRAARKKEMQAVERVIKDSINRLLPANYVIDAKVARYGTREFHVASRPPYCKSPSSWNAEN